MRGTYVDPRGFSSRTEEQNNSLYLFLKFSEQPRELLMIIFTLVFLSQIDEMVILIHRGAASPTIIYTE